MDVLGGCEREDSPGGAQERGFLEWPYDNENFYCTYNGIIYKCSTFLWNHKKIHPNQTHRYTNKWNMVFVLWKLEK